MSERIPFVQIDTSGAPMLDGVSDAEELTGTETGLLILGRDDSNNAQIVKTEADGAVAITDNSGSLTVDDGGASLTVDGSVSVSNFPATQPVSGSVSVSNFPATQPVSGSVSVSNLPPSPALGQAAMAASQPVVIASNQTAIPITDNSGSITVDGSVSVSNFPATQPVSGSVSVSNLPATQAVSAAALPLPTGAASESTLAALNTKTPGLGQAAMTASQPVVIASNQTAIPITDNSGSLTVDSAQLPSALVNGRLPVDGSGVTQPVSGSVGITGTPNVAVTSSTLPTGAASETTLAALNTKTPSLGQATMAASQPVVIASNQSAIPVSGSMTVTGMSTETTLSALNAKIPALGPAAMAASQPVTIASNQTAIPITDNSGSLTVDSTQLPSALVSGRLSVDGSGVTQPVSGSVSITGTPNVAVTSSSLPTGAATAAKQPAFGTAGTSSADVLTVQGRPSMTPLVVDGSAVTQPVSGSVTALTPDLVATGAIAAVGETVTTSDLDGRGAGSMVVTGTFVGTMQIEGSADGSTYTTLLARPATSTAANQSTVTAASAGILLRFSCGGFRSFRLRASAWTSGTANVTIRVSSAATAVTLTETPSVNSVQSGAWSTVNADTAGSSAALNALNAQALVVLAGRHSANVSIAAGTLTGTLVPEVSFDNGSNYVAATYFLDPVTEAKSATLVFTNPNALTARIIAVPSGATHARVRVSAWTSGTATATLRATSIINPPRLETGTPGAAVPPTAIQVAGSDGTNLVALRTASDGTQRVDPTGTTTQPVREVPPSTASLSNVPTSTTSAMLLASDPTRRGATIVNDSAAILYVKLGTTASATSYTVALAPAVSGVPSYYEVYQGYNGRIDAALSAGTGTARVTQVL